MPNNLGRVIHRRSQASTHHFIGPRLSHLTQHISLYSFSLFFCLFVFFYSCLIFRKRRRNAIRCWFCHVGSFVEIRANGLRLGYVCWQTRNWNGRIVDKNTKVVYLYRQSVGFSLSSWTAVQTKSCRRKMCKLCIKKLHDRLLRIQLPPHYFMYFNSTTTSIASKRLELVTFDN